MLSSAILTKGHYFVKRDHGLLAEGAASLTAEKIFDARWTMTVLGEALKKLRQEYATEEKRPHSRRYKFTWILIIVSRLRIDEVANRLGFHRRRGQDTYPSVGESATAHFCETRSAARCRMQLELRGIYALCDALNAAEGRLRS